jgi:hypothetical protein
MHILNRKKIDSNAKDLWLSLYLILTMTILRFTIESQYLNQLYTYKQKVIRTLYGDFGKFSITEQPGSEMRNATSFWSNSNLNSNFLVKKLILIHLKHFFIPNQFDGQRRTPSFCTPYLTHHNNFTLPSLKLRLEKE